MSGYKGMVGFHHPGEDCGICMILQFMVSGPCVCGAGGVSTHGVLLVQVPGVRLLRSSSGNEL